MFASLSSSFRRSTALFHTLRPSLSPILALSTLHCSNSFPETDNEDEKMQKPKSKGLVNPNGIAHIQLSVSRKNFQDSVLFYRQLCNVCFGMTPIFDNETTFYCVGARTGILISPCFEEYENTKYHQRKKGLHHIWTPLSFSFSSLNEGGEFPLLFWACPLPAIRPKTGGRSVAYIKTKREVSHLFPNEK